MQPVIDGKFQVVGPCSNAGGMGTLLFVTPVGTAGPPLVLKLCKLTDEEMRARFRREVRLMQQFAGSSYVVPITDANLDHDPPYFVMPHYEHGDLMGKAEQFRGNLEHVETVFNRMIDWSLSGILCARHSMTRRSMYAKQDESEERGHSRQVGRIAEDSEGAA